MDLSGLQAATIWTGFGELVMNEREVTLKLLHYLREIKRRRLYAEYGFASLWDMLIRGFKFSEGAAVRRLNAMELIRDYPDAEQKIRDGRLTLAVASQAQACFKQNELTPEQKTNLMQNLENKSSRAAAREICAVVPRIIPRESLRPLTRELSELRIVIDDELRHELDRLKETLSHVLPNPTYLEVIRYLARLGTQTLEKKLEAKSRTPKVKKLNVSAETRRAVWKRDLGQCTYKDPISGRRCESRHRVQLDHIQPRALGGKSEIENLRLLCQTHNLQAARQAFGNAWMDQFTGAP